MKNVFAARFYWSFKFFLECFVLSYPLITKTAVFHGVALLDGISARRRFDASAYVRA